MRKAGYYISTPDVHVNGSKGRFAYSLRAAQRIHRELMALSKWPEHVTIWKAWISECNTCISWTPR